MLGGFGPKFSFLFMEQGFKSGSVALLPLNAALCANGLTCSFDSNLKIFFVPVVAYDVEGKPWWRFW